eukprot:1054062-Rhodomonas_salina.1
MALLCFTRALRIARTLSSPSISSTLSISCPRTQAPRQHSPSLSASALTLYLHVTHSLSPLQLCLAHVSKGDPLVCQP